MRSPMEALTRALPEDGELEIDNGATWSAPALISPWAAATGPANGDLRGAGPRRCCRQLCTLPTMQMEPFHEFAMNAALRTTVHYLPDYSITGNRSATTQLDHNQQNFR